MPDDAVKWLRTLIVLAMREFVALFRARSDMLALCISALCLIAAILLLVLKGLFAAPVQRRRRRGGLAGWA